MKSIFLVIGVVAFTSATGQQKELFDIQDHLLKKNAELKKSNTPNIPLIPYSELFPKTNPLLSGQPYDSFQLPNGDLVITMQPGAMPVIKPDMRLFQTMPNPGLGNFTTHSIPNGAIPRRPLIIPSR
jgi:hypothetical protein